MASNDTFRGPISTLSQQTGASSRTSGSKVNFIELSGHPSGPFGNRCAYRSIGEDFVRVTIATVLTKISRFTSFRGVLLFLGMLGIAALCVGQAAKPVLTPAPQPAAPPPAPATTPAAHVVVGASYVIGPDDVLQVTVWKETTLSGTFPVRPDGMISMVLAGDISAAGQTPMQLATSISEKLKKCC